MGSCAAFVDHVEMELFFDLKYFFASVNEAPRFICSLSNLSFNRDSQRRRKNKLGKGEVLRFRQKRRHQRRCAAQRERRERVSDEPELRGRPGDSKISRVHVTPVAGGTASRLTTGFTNVYGLTRAQQQAVNVQLKVVFVFNQ